MPPAFRMALAWPLRRALPALAVVLCVSGAATAQTIPQRLDAYFAALHADGGFTGSVLLADRGTVVYRQSFGFADVASGVTNSDSTLVNIASISKTLTAIAVLQLRDGGKFALDDPYVRYVPEFPYQTITIRQLLSHTSGLPDSEQLLDSLASAHPDQVFVNGDVIPALVLHRSTRGLLFPPGERWSYSNLGFQLLALLVERASGLSFVDYMRAKVFLPAGMNDSYVQTALSQAQDRHRARAYMYANHFEMKLLRVDTLPYMRRFTHSLAGLTGSTNVVSSLRDLWAYDRALYAGALLKPATLEEAFTPTPVNGGGANVAATGAYGLGWFVARDSMGEKIVSHSGAGPGVTTFLIRRLARKQTLIVLQNVQNPGFKTAPVLRLLNGKAVVYRHSAAFAYAKDLFEQGPDHAFVLLQQRRDDSTSYALDEEEMDRVGLEFGRTRAYQHYSLEAYKLNTLFFPGSWRAFDGYASALLRNGKTPESIVMLRKAIALNPGHRDGAERLARLLSLR